MIRKADAGVAAILAVKIGAQGNDELAAILRPLVEALPVRRCTAAQEISYDEEAELTDDMCAAARDFVELQASPAPVRDPWDARARLRKLQRLHLESDLADAIGEIPGFKIRGQVWDDGDQLLVWRKDQSIDLDAPLLALPTNMSRAEAVIAVMYHDQGYRAGIRVGEKRIQNGLKDLLDL